MAVPNPENKKPIALFFQVWWDHIWMLVGVSAVHSLLKLLIITSGLADAGMANVTRNLACGKHSFGVSDFMDTVKDNWKQSLIIGIINTLLYAVMAIAVWFYISAEGLVAQIAIGVMVASFLVLSFAQFYMWLIVVTFTMPVGRIYKNSILLAFANLKTNLLAGVLILVLYAVAVLPILLLPSIISLAFTLFLIVLVLPGFTSLLAHWMVFPVLRRYMIDPYYEEHPDADIELRKSLGIYEESKPADPPVFKDTM